eukprot:sb/3468057/
MRIPTCYPLYRTFLLQVMEKVPSSVETVILFTVHSTLALVDRVLSLLSTTTSYDITAICMIYSNFVFLLSGPDVSEITEPRSTGEMTVIYSNLNRMLAALSVVTVPLKNLEEYCKSVILPEMPEKESDNSSSTTESPKLSHGHRPTPQSGSMISYHPSVWLSNLLNVENLDFMLIHLLRCFNKRSPDKSDILMLAIANNAKICQLTQLYHNRDTSKFEYNVKMLLHECLSSIFAALSLTTPSIPPVIFKFTKLLCAKAKLKAESEIPVLKLVSL